MLVYLTISLAIAGFMNWSIGASRSRSRVVTGASQFCNKARGGYSTCSVFSTWSSVLVTFAILLIAVENRHRRLSVGRFSMQFGRPENQASAAWQSVHGAWLGFRIEISTDSFSSVPSRRPALATGIGYAPFSSGFMR